MLLLEVSIIKDDNTHLYPQLCGAERFRYAYKFKISLGDTVHPISVHQFFTAQALAELKGLFSTLLPYCKMPWPYMHSFAPL